MNTLALNPAKALWIPGACFMVSSDIDKSGYFRQMPGSMADRKGVNPPSLEIRASSC
jgi:hypothetical protein